MLEPMTLLGNTEKKINKDRNSEKVAHLEITELVLVYCIIINNDYQHDSEVLYTFVPNKSFGQLLDISLKKLYLQKPLIESFVILKYGLLIKGLLPKEQFKKQQKQVVTLLVIKLIINLQKNHPKILQRQLKVKQK